MQWLELLTLLEASAELVMASLSCVYLARYAREATTTARRVGGAALALVCVGLALESALFLSLAPAVASPTRSAAVVVVRSALLLSTALLGLLLVRHAWPRR